MHTIFEEVAVAYDEDLADNIRHLFTERGTATVERQMFGGLAFMVRGHMTLGVLGDDLMVRVGKDAHEDVVALPHVREMDLTGKPMTGMVLVSAPGVADQEQLRTWIERGLAFTSTLPSR